MLSANRCSRRDRRGPDAGNTTSNNRNSPCAAAPADKYRCAERPMRMRTGTRAAISLMKLSGPPRKSPAPSRVRAGCSSSSSAHGCATVFTARLPACRSAAPCAPPATPRKEVAYRRRQSSTRQPKIGRAGRAAISETAERFTLRTARRRSDTRYTGVARHLGDGSSSLRAEFDVGALSPSDARKVTLNSRIERDCMISRTLGIRWMPPCRRCGDLKNLFVELQASVVCATRRCRESGTGAAVPPPPEEKRLRHLTVTFGHAADTSSRRTRRAHGGDGGASMPEAQILVGKRRRRCILRSALTDS